MEGVVIPTQALREANHRLDLLLTTLGRAQDCFPISAEQMAAALAEVLRVGEWLRAGLSNQTENGMPEELRRYRQHLEQLRQLLPGVHAQLLTERSRLEAERTHLESAAAWARSASSR
jgi:hypothetical protein